MREIKFRVWEESKKRLIAWDTYKDHYQALLIGLMDEPEEGWAIMQYTGLKDKNGREIYEGDILKSNFGRIGPVVWYRRGFFIEAESHPDGVTDFLVWERSEIIGNIYENPELLK